MLEKVWFPFHSSVFHINKALVTDFTRPVRCLENNSGTLGVERKEETRKQSQLHSESETEERTVGKRAGPQGLPNQPLVQASPLSHRKEGAEPCCHQRRSIRIPLGRDSHISWPAKGKGQISKRQIWQVTNQSLHMLFLKKKKKKKKKKKTGKQLNVFIKKNATRLSYKTQTRKSTRKKE